MLTLYVDRPLRDRAITSVASADLSARYSALLRGGRRDGRRGLSSRTVRYLHAILNKALADAVRAGLITLNPATTADPPSVRASRPPVFRVWTPAELARFLESAEGDPLYPAFHLAATTGLRRGELLGLRWCDLDEQARELHVVQSVVEVAHQVCVTPPKTDRSRRLVSLDVRTADVLARHRAAIGRVAADGLIFCDPDRAPIHPALFSYYFQQRVKAAGVPRIRLHDLRHTHATHALKAGIHPKVVSERLGHATIAITLDTYSHVLPSLQREAAETVAALISL